MREPNDTPSGTPSEPPKQSTVLLLLGTIADTTWRMFVPTIGMLLLGLWLDKHFNTLPWALGSFTVVGALIAAYLVRNQFKNVNKK